MSHLLELDGVERRFGGLKVLQGVNLAIPKGGVFGLIGFSGQPGPTRAVAQCARGAW